MSAKTMTPTTAVSDNTVGTVAWTNPSNATVADDSKATATLLLGQQTEYLKATAFGFEIPLDATILGLQVDVEASGTVISTVQDVEVRVCRAGTPVGDVKTAGGFWATIDTVRSYGGAADLWGTTWTPADVNASTFGCAISASALAALTANIDSVSMTVTWIGSNRLRRDKPMIKVGAGASCSN